MESLGCLDCYWQFLDGLFAEIEYETVNEDGSQTRNDHDQHTEDLKISLARPVSET